MTYWWQIVYLFYRIHTLQISHLLYIFALFFIKFTPWKWPFGGKSGTLLVFLTPFYAEFAPCKWCIGVKSDLFLGTFSSNSHLLNNVLEANLTPRFHFSHYLWVSKRQNNPLCWRENGKKGRCLIKLWKNWKQADAGFDRGSSILLFWRRITAIRSDMPHKNELTL